MDNDCSLAGFESQNEGIMQNHPPETPDNPLGPTFIEAGIQYTYCAFTHDPDADLIRYRFDWGDGSISNWTQLETSNIPVYMSHSWITISTFDVKVIAQDENGLNSSWSPVLSGAVSQVESIEIPPFVDKSVSNFEKFIWNSNGNHWEATGINIQIAINDLRETGGTVWIPDGEITISSRIFTVDNLTLSFSGKLKLNDGGVEQISMISCDDENVTFKNPQLDMDRVNNKVNTTFGMQIAIYFTGSSNNCKIYGGNIENACQVGIGGCSHNLNVYGLKISEPGEHGVYFNTWASDIHLDGMEIYLPGRISGGRGYGFKIAKTEHCNVNDVVVTYNGSENWPNYSSIGFVIGCASKDINIKGKVVNADYGFLISSPYDGVSNQDINISLHLDNCTTFNRLTDDENVSGVHIYDSYTNFANVYANKLGNGAVIENVRGVGPAQIIANGDYNSSYTIRNCHFTTDGNYPWKLEKGYDITLENNIIENTGTTSTSYCCVLIKDITGIVTLRDNIFRGGTHWNVRLDSSPAAFIVERNRFRESYNDITATTSIQFVRHADREHIITNINQVDIIRYCFSGNIYWEW